MKLHFAVALVLARATNGLVEVGRAGTVAENAYEDADLTNMVDTSYLGSDDLPEGSKKKTKMKKLEAKYHKTGRLRCDARSGVVSNVNPDEAVMPGKGNRLLWTVHAGHPADARELKMDKSKAAVDAVKGWMADNAEDLGVDVANELFSSSSSGRARVVDHGDGNTVQIYAGRTFKGLRVVGASATATVKKGNLMSVGLERWGNIPKNFSTKAKITADQAKEILANHAGRALAEGETCKPELVVLTLANGKNPGGNKGKGGKGKNGNGKNPFKRNLRKVKDPPDETGNGYKPALAWQVCPKLEGQEHEMMTGYVEAGNASGKVYLFQDEVDYFEAKGDVYPTTNDNQAPDGVLQVGWPMPYLTVGSQTTTTGGVYDTGGALASLDGKYVRMNDNCGTASLSSSGGLDWGGSDGTDCATPGFGGNGNTHSSRSGFYELNKMKEIARGYLPNNNWLKQKLVSNMNINSSCNAFWSNGQVNFYRSGGGCGNTGEIAAIFDHEWGHGMDANDVNGGIASPSGEGIADIYSALRLNDSCIGRNFRTTGSVCNTGGNLCTGGCTGVREIDYKKKQRNAESTVTWANANCNGSVHCLGYVYSEAVWNLYTEELPNLYGYDQNTALELTQRLTYVAAGQVNTWYSTSSSAIPWGGCGASSGYREYLLADDDDSNLGNGTPHMQAIYNAFNRQEIACNDVVVQDSGCPGTSSLTAPDVTVTPGFQTVQLAWTSVPGAATYQVFRTEGVWGCSQGKVLLATTTSLAYLDVGLQNGREYYYIVIPKGESDPDSSCFGASSSCMTAVPAAFPDIEISCSGDVLSNIDDAPSSIVRDCTVSAMGGYTGVVSLSCASAMTGVSCSPGLSSVEFTSGEMVEPVSVTIQVSTSATLGQGDATLTANGGTGAKLAPIPITLISGGGPQVASYDGEMGAPHCFAVGSECSSISSDGSVHLLKGRGNVGPEVNEPNTIDGCADGASGIYDSDESSEWITVKSNGLGNMREGDLVTVDVGVHCWSTGGNDSVDIYHTTTPGEPNWIFIDTIVCPGGGFQTVSTQYTIPDGQNDGTNAIRVNFRYNGSAGACTGGAYDDHDDLVFLVETASGTSAPTKNPTPSPSISPIMSPTQNPSKAPSLPPTSSPIAPTEPPSVSPTSHPTKSPTVAPTANPTSSPSSSPSTSPTQAPTNSPIAPTPPPTTSPVVSPTKAPTGAPTPQPTISPVSPNPPPTPAPTLPPTPAPTTPGPGPCAGADITVDLLTDRYGSETTWTLTNQCNGVEVANGSGYASQTPYLESFCFPAAQYRFFIADSFGDGICCSVGQGSISVSYNGAEVLSGGDFGSSKSATFGSDCPNRTIATFDSDLNVPKCSGTASICTSGPALLKGTGGNDEPNPSNTLDGCTDGPSGSYQSDESIDQITVSAVGGGQLQAGVTAEIQAKVWAWNTGSSDVADFYYTATVNPPNWVFIQSVNAGGAGFRNLKAEYTIPSNNPVQAVRVNFRYQGSQKASACNGGTYDDADDLVFDVDTTPVAAFAGVTGPKSARPANPLDSRVCTAMGKRDKKRCQEGTLCEWKNGKKAGCYPKNRF